MLSVDGLNLLSLAWEPDGTLSRGEGRERRGEVIKMVSRASAALLIVLAVGAVPIAASASPPETETTTGKDTETFVDVAPTYAGGGPLYEITIDYNFVEHSTVSADGAHFTFTNTGTFVAVALVPASRMHLAGSPNGVASTRAPVVR